jgi:hypothetical protein
MVKNENGEDVPT